MQTILLLLLILIDLIVRSTVVKIVRKFLLLEWGMSHVQHIILRITQ